MNVVLTRSVKFGKSTIRELRFGSTGGYILPTKKSRCLEPETKLWKSSLFVIIHLNNLYSLI